MIAPAVIYWDTSAVLSALFQDQHSKAALECSRRPGLHLLSTLTWAEAHAVIARIERERMLAEILVRASRETLATGPWRRVNAVPEWSLVRELASKWPLRGADLWHLATARGLQTELPELRILSYDSRLAAAAVGAGLGV